LGHWSASTSAAFRHLVVRIRSVIRGSRGSDNGSPPWCPSGLERNLFTLTMTGLALSALFGWAWADPATVLIVAFAAAREGRENIREAAELADDAEDRGEH
jgi:hypothetical protein